MRVSGQRAPVSGTGFCLHTGRQTSGASNDTRSNRAQRFEGSAVFRLLTGKLRADELVVTAVPDHPQASHILIVEGDGVVRELLQLLLRSHGYETALAGSGDEALARLRERRPCLMLVDLHLPGMSGWELRERQLEDPAIADVPVICMTAMYEPADVEEQLGAPCLRKPVDFPGILRAVQSACGPARP